MTSAIHRHNGAQELRQWANLFEITNRGELSTAYRLLEVRGLPAGEHYDRNVNRLAKAVAYELHQPVALVRRNGGHHLAIRADAALPNLQQRLMPHVVHLIPGKDTYPLEFTRLDGDTRPIAVAFLRFALRNPLWRDQDLWESGRACYRKQPLNGDDRGATVDVYPGFVWSVVATEDGRLFIAVDTTVRYVDRRWLTDRLNGAPVTPYLRRHCLYHFGRQWYMVQLWNVTGLSIAQQCFLVEGENRLVSVLAYTQERRQAAQAPWIADLDPESPAILYRYPGNERERYGALALCKLALSTADVEAAGFHHRSIPDPARRFEAIITTVARHFQHARLGSRPIRVATSPLEIERRVFAVPPQRFGQDRILAVGPEARGEGATVVPLEQLGQKRLRLLLDPQVGPLDTSPFDAQYLFLPLSAPRAINEDFARRFELAMREVSGQPRYILRRILYDDRGATSLYRQVQAIKRAIAENSIDRGYALLVLPERAARDLHNHIKRASWPALQFQCAMARKIRGHYQRHDGEPSFRPAPDREGRLASYVRNCALGLMIVNRKWPWALASPLHYDVYVGIDVLNGIAGLTFVYNNGRQIFFCDYPCKQKERLTTAQLRHILLTHLREDLVRLRLRPRSLVVHRDGRTFPSELNGLRAAVEQLKQEGVLPADLTLGVVDIRKTSTDHLRLVEGQRVNAVRNPTIGSYHVLGPREGVVCTTGWPFRFPGTAKPLAAVIVDGGLDIEWVLEDLFALSQLVFAAPDKCARLPLTIKLADDLLEPIAADADEEAALYEAEPIEALEAMDDDDRGAAVDIAADPTRH